MGWVLDQSKAQGRARLVLLSIANHASASGGNVYCGLNRLASESLVHRATVIRALQHLEEIGELLVYEHKGVSGRGGTTNRYEMPKVPGWKAPVCFGSPRTDPCGYHQIKRSQNATPDFEEVADRVEEVAPRASRGRNLRPEPSLTVRYNQQRERWLIDGKVCINVNGHWVPEEEVSA